MASTYLSRTFGTPTNASKFTISVWVKRSALGGSWKTILSSYVSGTRYTNFSFNGSDQFAWHILDSSEVSKLYSNAKYRDVNGWYHLVFNWDSTQATASDRTKLWVNGEQITSWNTQTNSAQNTNYEMNTAVTHYIGAEKGNTGGSIGNYFDGSMSHFHFSDGYVYPASTFGETDATTGEWKIKTSPTFTLGNNGFTILKDGNTITDQSANSNNWTLGAGTLTNTEDCPSDVFATMNVLDNQNQASTFTMGNTKLEWNTNNKNNFANFAINKGKFYWEMKYADNTGGTDAMIGISKCDERQGDDYPGHDATAWSYYASNGNKYNNGGSTYGNSWTTNDIIGVAFDADTRTLWFSKNGTWQNSATISEIGAGTTTNSAWTGMGTAGEYFIPCMSGYDGNKAEFNFGNGYFGTTQISSEGTNASNIGKFEYDVPTNFTALSLKGINS